MTDLFEEMNASIIDGEAEISAERLADVDADFVFTTYDPDREDQRSPSDMLALLNEIIPDACRFLTACANRQVIFLERTPLYSGSFRSLEIAVNQISTHIAGRENASRKFE